MYSILFLISSAIFAQNTWQEYHSDEGRFQIMLPGIFTEKIDSIDTEVGDLVYHTLFLQTEDSTAENLFYMISYCDYPTGVVFADSIGLTVEFFQTTVEAAAESVKGEIVYSSDIKLGTHPGKQWRIEYLEGKVVIKNRAYLVDSRYYSLQTISYKEKSLNADGTGFSIPSS